MSSRAWRCRCARLESRWIRFHKFVSPSGYYDEEYVCEAKKFFLPMIPGMRVGGWKGDCENGECTFCGGGFKCQHGDDDAWCDMAIVPARDDQRAEGCTCSVDHCPFFRPRTADEWMSAVRCGEVPFLTRRGTLRPEAKVAKGYFALSDEVFDGLVEEMKARSKKQGGARC